MLAIIIGFMIAGYTGYLIYRQINNVKKGNFCGNCSGCQSVELVKEADRNRVLDAKIINRV